MMTRKTTVLFTLLLCVLTRPGFGEDATATLKLEDKNDNILRGFAQFADPNASKDELYVETKDRKSGLVVVPTGVKVRQGHKDSFITRRTGAETTTGSGVYHVAEVEKRDGKSLYEVYGRVSIRVSPGETKPISKWQADYSSGGGQDKRIIAFVNDSVDINVKLAGAFPTDDYLTVKLTGWTWNETYNSAEDYTYTLTDQDDDPDDKGHVVCETTTGHIGWISAEEFCDIRYVPIRGTVEGFTKIKVTTAPTLPPAYAYAYIGGIEVTHGFRFVTPDEKEAGIVTNPAADETRLGYKYMYIPAACKINGKESTNFAVLKLASGVPDRQEPENSGCPFIAVFMKRGESLVPCLRIRSTGDMWSLPPLQAPYTDNWNYWEGWTQYLADANQYALRFGGTPHTDLPALRDAMQTVLTTAIGEPDAIAAGQYWLSPPITDVEPDSPMTFLLVLTPGRPGNEGNGGRHPKEVYAQRPDPKNSLPEDKVKTPAVAASVKVGRTVPITVLAPEQVGEYGKLEAEIRLDPNYFSHLAEKDGQTSCGLLTSDRFDAYDADFNGNRIQVDARFRCGQDTPINVACFVMKEAFSGPWKWKVRFAPPKQGKWDVSVRAVVWHTRPVTKQNYDEQNTVVKNSRTIRYHYWGYDNDEDDLFGVGTGNHHTGKFQGKSLPMPTAKTKTNASDALQPLTLAGSGQNPMYFYRGDTPVFLSGRSRSWTDKNWTTYCAQMKVAKLNFNNLWFAPWETMLVHESSKGNTVGHEEWRSGWFDPTTEQVPATELWRPWSYYDQGRADLVDRIIAEHALNSLYVGLTLWPHGALATQNHGWPEKNWDAGDTNARNGFDRVMSVDNFFSTTASPWLWQKNLYRYIIARYGWSPNLALWGTVAEVEGVGTSTSYWYNQRGRTRPWHSVVSSTIHALDYRSRPVTGWGTYMNDWPPMANGAPNAYTRSKEQALPQDHGCFTAKDYTQKTDVWAFDSYPWIWPSNVEANARTNNSDFPQQLTQMSSHCYVWHYIAARMPNWVKNCQGEDPGANKPFLVTEYGITETGVDAKTIRSFMHYANWAAFASGHAGVPLKWFDADCFEEITAVANFWNAISGIAGSLTERLLPQAEPTGAPVVIGIRSSDKSKCVLWVFHDEKCDLVGRTYATAKADNLKTRNISFPVANMTPNATYSVTPYNTWSGNVENAPACQVGDVTADANGKVTIYVGQLCETERDAWDGADIVYVLQQK